MRSPETGNAFGAGWMAKQTVGNVAAAANNACMECY